MARRRLRALARWLVGCHSVCAENGNVSGWVPTKRLPSPVTGRLPRPAGPRREQPRGVPPPFFFFVFFFFLLPAAQVSTARVHPPTAPWPIKRDGGGRRLADYWTAVDVCCRDLLHARCVVCLVAAFFFVYVADRYLTRLDAVVLVCPGDCAIGDLHRAYPYSRGDG